MEIAMSAVPAVAEGIKTRSESFGLLVVSKRTPILVMNEDSAAVWQRIDGTHNVSEIIASLQELYDNAENEIPDTVLSFLENCKRLHLIEIHE